MSEARDQGLVARPAYLKTLEAWKGKPVIKVITGVRRCGKSTLMDLWERQLRHEGVTAEHIVHINLELLEHESLLEYHALHDAVLRRCSGEGMYYVLIDEIQNVPQFQKAVDSLYVRENIDLTITGSNAMLLSGTLATLLSGRYVEISVTPYSFAEFAHANEGAPASPQRLWSEYLHRGSFPAITNLTDDMLVSDYLDGVFSTILIKDVAQRTSANVALLRTLATYMYDNIGNLATAKSIADALTSQGTKISPPTVSSYLEALASAYLLYPVERFDVKGKRILKQERKYYAVDMGLRRVLCSNSVRDSGRLLENVVFLELLRREKHVFVGRDVNGEIDFVTNGSEGIKYWQVAQSVTAPETLKRELSSFAPIRDNYPKTLLTLDDTRPISHNGIWQRYALDWLLGK